MHTYTCLMAPAELQALGFSTVVAREDDRVPLAAFKDGAAASKWCDELNGITQNEIEENLDLSQSAEVAVSHT